MLRIIYMVLSCVVVSFGVFILQSSQVITGGTAGLALSISYLLSSSFAIVFFMINIPFYILSVFKMGWKFTLSTIFAVTTLSLMTEVIQFLPTIEINAIFGSILGGIICGFGLSFLFMNGSSLGGANILALVLQRRFHIDPGKTTFAFDFAVILTGLMSVGLLRGIYSVLSIIMISMIISYFKGKIAKKNADPEPVQQAQKAS
ncbi:YitT family protein [Bacillus shivajii]|uniref:YitT family protein n=1 Tax=Bacillus shivajii TaxID=1983719 RepID=UPI001CFB1784|nr:YitT family protein [Bacillus shivajii]UCZ55181.1 YitT family protein [Bacillus shivajii]